MGRFAAIGWFLAFACGAVAVGEFYLFERQKAAALAEQAAAYEARLAEQKAAADAQVRKIQDDATAQLTVLQTELDFQKMPEIPLQTEFQRNRQVLFVQNNARETFSCKVRLFRPIGGVSRELDFELKAGAYQDMAAIGDWLFAKGDRVEFVKAGYKPRSLVVP